MLENLTVGSAFQAVHNGRPCWIAQASYTDADGKRRFIRGIGATERQAMQRRQQNIAKRLHAPTRVSPTVNALLTRWIDSYGPNDVTEEVRRKHQRNIELHVSPHVGSLQLVNLDRERVAKLFSHDLASLPDGAWRNTYKSMRTMLMYAVKYDLITSHPMIGLKQRNYVATVRDDDIQLIDERTSIALDLLRWLRETKHKHYALVLFSFLGLRRSELLGLTWNCLDGTEQASARIHVRQQLARAKGKGWFIEPRTKNNKTRSIYLPDEWWLVLMGDVYLRTYPEQGDWRDELVFRRDDGNFISYNDYAHVWTKVLEDYSTANKREFAPWRPHYNRHITASMMFRSGQNLEYVQELLGHSDSTMTLYYTHFSETAKREAMIAYGDAIEHADWAKARKVDFREA